MMRLFLGIISISLLAACAVSSEDKASWDPEQVREEVIQMFDDYHSNISEYGLTGEFAYLDSTDQFYWVPPGFASALDYDSVRSILETNAPGFSEIEFKWESLEVYPLSDSIATYTGIVYGEMTDTAGTEIISRIIESGTVIRRPGGWKLLCGQSAVLE